MSESAADLRGGSAWSRLAVTVGGEVRVRSGCSGTEGVFASLRREVRRGRLRSRGGLPRRVAAVDDLAAAHVEEVDGEHVVFVVEAEDVGVFVVGGGDALLVLGLADGDELVAEAGGELELHVLGGGFMRAVRRASSSLGLPSRKSCTSRMAWR